MIAIIRISGQIDVVKDIKETLSRLRLRKKFVCVVIDERKEILGMLMKVRNFVAYGKINDKTLEELIKKRGKAEDKKKKIDAKEASEMILKNRSFEGTGLKPFFRLHPPRGGFDSKKHFPRGVLGNHGDKINELIIRML